MATTKVTPTGPAAHVGKKIDDAFSTYVEKIQEAKQNMESNLPDLTEGVKKILHATSYYVAYGVLSAAEGVNAFFSKEGPVISGFREGMTAAKKKEPMKAPPRAAKKPRPAAKRKAKPKQEMTIPAK
jgi:hypothetical protein